MWVVFNGDTDASADRDSDATVEGDAGLIATKRVPCRRNIRHRRLRIMLLLLLLLLMLLLNTPILRITACIEQVGAASYDMFPVSIGPRADTLSISYSSRSSGRRRVGDSNIEKTT